MQPHHTALNVSSPAQRFLIPPTVPAPTLMTVAQWRRLAPAWLNATTAMHFDARATGVWNWIVEMIGWAVGAANAGLNTFALQDSLQVRVTGCGGHILAVVLFSACCSCSGWLFKLPVQDNT